MKAAAQPRPALQVMDIIDIDLGNKYSAHKRLANGIIHVTRKNGSCAEQDLLPLGFPIEEIAERWHMARAMADVELRLMNARSSK